MSSIGGDRKDGYHWSVSGGWVWGTQWRDKKGAGVNIYPGYPLLVHESNVTYMSMRWDILNVSIEVHKRLVDWGDTDGNDYN